MQRLVFAVLMVAFLAAADDAKKDSQQLEGTWLMVSAVHNGKKMDDGFVGKSKLVVNGDHHTVTLGDTTNDARQRLDASKTPKTIDITWNDGTRFSGIYELSDNELKICIPASGKARPTEFTSPDGSGKMLHVWKREKK